MNAERWARAQELFHRAVKLDVAERSALLDAECGADAELREEIERLLRFDAEEGDAFTRVDARAPRTYRDPLVGQRLGAFRVLERIASGGMGVVYRAERADGLFQQEVAIKLIRGECATDWTLRRFEFERRTLAALQHPNIARLYDGGADEYGRPYFVMEYVRGEPIDAHCARQRLSIAARLRLFVRVCRAVQFAHQNLFVHCDLKPANILIDERGEPRLLDFGIARWLADPAERPADDKERVLTRVLTPEYSSPEQLAGAAVTTSVDVYALGVVLYELLTRRRPFDTDSRDAAEWARQVREQPPERPSTAVRHADAAELATQLGAAPASVMRALRGDLDRIVLMALRKEPERRYASAQEFADDVERFLSGLPVRARDNSLGYLASKFVRRHRVAVAAGVSVVAALLFGWLSARESERLATAEAIHARQEAGAFENLAAFLMDAFLPVQAEQGDAWREQARERIELQAERVRRQYADDGHGRANMLDALGEVALRLELFDDAEGLIREALAIREATFGVRSLEYSRSLTSLGHFCYEAGQFAQAAEHFERALELHRAAKNEIHAEVAGRANDLAAALRSLGRSDEAEALHVEALALRRAAGDRTLAVAESLNNLAAAHADQARFEPATEELREALDIRESTLGPGHPLTLQTLSNLATTLWRSGRSDEALEALARAESGYRELRGDGERELALALANHAAMSLAVSDYEGAARSLEEALALQRRRLGDEHPVLADTLTKLAVVRHAQRDDARARELWSSAIAIRRASETAPQALAETLYGYGVFLLDTGDFEGAANWVGEAAATLRALDTPDPLALGRAEYVLGMCAARSDDRSTAKEHFEAALQLLRQRAESAKVELERVERELRTLDASSAR